MALHTGYQSFEDSAICASVIVRKLGAGLKVWRSSAGLREKDQVTTKRVESLRAPCLDASSTLATSTKKDGLKSVFFLWSRLGRSAGGVSGDLSMVG